MDNYVIKNMPQHNIPDQKPVNINISFNINRKQVNQNMNTYQPQESFKIKSHLADPLNYTSVKNKNINIKPPKTPQLALTQRNLYNKDLTYLRTTQQMKRKKRSKKNSGDYTIDKTTFLPFYNQQMDRSLPNHNRGHTTALIKKPTNIKPKKILSLKGDQTARQNRMSIIEPNNKGQIKSSMIQKNLKVMINKIISNQLSKRSLPLPTVANKTKFNNSASLTNRKSSKNNQKKKSSKKLNKEKITNSMEDNLAYCRQQISVNQKSLKQNPILNFNRNELIQKLSSFKSVQNSYLMSQVDKNEQKQQNFINESKNKRTIVIKTDQSMECIQQIQNYQRNRFKQEFFDKKEDQKTLHRRNQTQYLIQTYIKLLRQTQNQNQYIYLDESRIKNINNQKQYQNHLNQSDCFKFQQILKSEININENENRNSEQQKLLRNSEKLSEISKLQHKQQIENQQQQNQQKDQQNKNIIARPQKQYKNLIPSKDNADYLNNNTQTQYVRYIKQDVNQQNQFKPFISSQIGRQSFKHKNHKNNNGQNNEEQQQKKLNQLKKQQILKWGYLLQFIKDNMNKETDTQTVLQTVYKYLQKAKVDLLKQGNHNLFNNNKSNKSRQIQEFTNKLSSQYEKSSKDYYNSSSNKQSSKTDDYQMYDNTNKQFNSSQLYATKQQQFNNKIKHSQNKQQIDQQVLSFKQDYSQQDDQQIKYMNLQTIDSALKNRFNALNQRKIKQLSILQDKYESNKICQQQFKVQKQKILKWIKKQTDQIVKVKKNIWKGYNEARGILDKSYLNSRCIEEKSAQKKMMKCLSQTYLSNKRLDYKKYIEDEIKKEDQQQKELVFEQNNSKQSQQEHDYELQSSNQDDQNIQYSNQQTKNEQQEQAYIKDEKLTQNSKIQDIKQYIRNTCLSSSPSKNQKTGKQLNKKIIKPHLNNEQFLQSELIQKYQKEIQDQHQNEFALQQYSKSQSQNKSLQSEKSNPISPSSIHYEQLQEQINSSDDEMNYYDNFDNQSKQNEQASLSREQVSDQEQRQIIQKELNLTSKVGLSKIKNQQKKQPNKQEIYLQKLKYITEQDKQDIFEFLFLDLCIQLYQQPCKDNKFMNTINKHIEKVYQLSKRKKGVKTNLNVVKDYLKRFCGYVLRTNKKALENLQVPMGPTAIQMLRYMHENEDLDEQLLDEGEEVVTLIVPIQSFDTFERSLLPTLQFQKYYEDEQKQNQRVNFLKNILHIHNKALFDALNQFLDQQRPFGIWGKPFPWKKASSFSHKLTDVQIQQKLKKSAQKVVQACSYVCGLLVDKQQSLVANAKVSEAYIEQIREDRISRMLANDMIQNQERWVFYDDEQTQVLVQAGNTIYNQLVREFVEDYIFLMNRQIQI